MTRREFMALTAAAGAAAGCATNPVTGRRQFMVVSEAQEVELDRKWAPQQFSADYGAAQDPELNRYLSDVGMTIAPVTHRPAMPYNFRVVNSVVVNGYTMPAGSVAMCRGLMLSLDNEAQLAGVLGHELGHVNARHAGERMSKNIVLMALVTGVTAYVSYEKQEYADLAAGLGGIGAGLLLSRYSRDDEREADALGMEYMTRAGYNPAGMVGLMDNFRKLHASSPSSVELLFATHPLSGERYDTAASRLRSQYAAASTRDERRQRYMDNTARLRAMQGAIASLQKGEEALMRKKTDEADRHLGAGLKAAPDDYAGLLLMAKCRLAQNRAGEAERFAQRARDVYPDEPQAEHVLGMAKMGRGQFDGALSHFASYEARLPGNANSAFFKGYCLDRMGRRTEAVREYARYRQAAPSGEYAGAVQQRLMEWGYVTPPPPK